MNKQLAGILASIFMLLVAVASLATSALFFVNLFEFGGEVAGSTASMLVTASVGVLVTDIALYAWTLTYLKIADNSATRALAAIGAFIGGAGSILATVAYMLLFARKGVVVATAGTDWIFILQIMMGVVLAGHVTLFIVGMFRSTGARIDTKAGELMAEAQDEMFVLTEQMFRAEIPALAQQNAQRMKQKLAERFVGLSTLAPAPSGAESLSKGASGSAPPLQPQSGPQYARHFTDEEMREKEAEWMQQGRNLEALAQREAQQAANGQGGGDDIGPPFRGGYDAS